MPAELEIPEAPPAPPAANPDPVAKAFDRLAPIYDGLYRSDRTRLEDERLLELLGNVLDIMPPWHGRNVLDVGCGTGLFMKLTSWPEDGYVGLDVSPGMMELARIAYPRATFHLGDVENIPLVDDCMDAAVSLYGPLSYVKRPVRALAEIHRVLRRDAPAFLMVYAPGWYQTNCGVMGDTDLQTSPAAWTVWQAKHRMSMAGFVNVRLSAFSMLPTWLIPFEGFLAKRYPHRGRYLIMEGNA